MRHVRWPADGAARWWLPDAHHTGLAVLDGCLGDHRGLPDALAARVAHVLCTPVVAAEEADCPDVWLPGVWKRLTFAAEAVAAGITVEVRVLSGSWRWMDTVVVRAPVGGTDEREGVCCLAGMLPLVGSAAVFALVVLDAAGDPVCVNLGVEPRPGVRALLTSVAAVAVTAEENPRLTRAVWALVGTHTDLPRRGLMRVCGGHDEGEVFLPPDALVGEWDAGQRVVGTRWPGAVVLLVPRCVRRSAGCPALLTPAPTAQAVDSEVS